MALTFASRRLRHQRAMDERFAREHLALAQRIGDIVFRVAAARSEPLANTRRQREQLKQAVWNQVLKPYYIGPGTDPFDGERPQSPYARLLVDGVEGVIRIQAEAQLAFLRRYVNDDLVFNWLTGPRPIGAVTEQAGSLYDPFHRWVDPAGYRLSDRVWRNAIDVRARIDRLLDYHIAQGTAAVDIAEELERFLTPGAKVARTRTPYGTEGSYAARRLARTEISAAAGRGTVNASIANPFVAGVRWSLSRSHAHEDICDVNASGGPAGDGVYPVDEVPTYPAHPHCMCNLQPVPIPNRAEVIAAMRADIQAQQQKARRMQGVFNADWLVRALMAGFFDEAIEAIVGV